MLVIILWMTTRKRIVNPFWTNNKNLRVYHSSKIFFIRLAVLSETSHNLAALR